MVLVNMISKKEKFNGISCAKCSEEDFGTYLFQYIYSKWCIKTCIWQMKVCLCAHILTDVAGFHFTGDPNAKSNNDG